MFPGSTCPCRREGGLPVYTGARFLLYERVKEWTPTWVPAPAAFAGGLAGVLSVVLTNPIDVIKTHIQAWKDSNRSHRFLALNASIRTLARRAI